MSESVEESGSKADYTKFYLACQELKMFGSWNLPCLRSWKGCMPRVEPESTKELNVSKGTTKCNKEAFFAYANVIDPVVSNS